MKTIEQEKEEILKSIFRNKKVEHIIIDENNKDNFNSDSFAELFNKRFFSLIFKLGKSDINDFLIRMGFISSENTYKTESFHLDIEISCSNENKYGFSFYFISQFKDIINEKTLKFNYNGYLCRIIYDKQIEYKEKNYVHKIRENYNFKDDDILSINHYYYDNRQPILNLKIDFIIEVPYSLYDKNNNMLKEFSMFDCVYSFSNFLDYTKVIRLDEIIDKYFPDKKELFFEYKEEDVIDIKNILSDDELKILEISLI